MIILQMTPEQLASTIADTVAKAIAEGNKKELEERLLSPEEACKIFTPNISLVTLYRWEKEGRIQKYKTGRNTYYKYSEIIASLDTVKKYKRAS